MSKPLSQNTEYARDVVSTLAPLYHAGSLTKKQMKELVIGGLVQAYGINEVYAYNCFNCAYKRIIEAVEEEVEVVVEPVTRKSKQKSNIVIVAQGYETRNVHIEELIALAEKTENYSKMIVTFV